MISNRRHNNKFKHSHVLIIMSFLFECVNSSTSTAIPTFLGNQLVANADKQTKCIDKERNVLLDFKATILRYPYDRLPTWGTKKEDVDDDCCNWDGVMCNNETGHVTELHLHRRGLQGQISPSLLNLTSLTHLDLYDNFLNGSIPKSIGSLAELTHLDLSYNFFNGTIPESIVSLTELKYLSLGWNSFNGTIPVSIGYLTKLRDLDLRRNSFDGTIPVSIGSLTELRYLDLSRNSFDGTIPVSIGSLTELRYLDLSRNSFDGTIPVSIGSLTELRYLDLSRNSFDGTIPVSIGSLTELRYLDLYNNSFSGSIPKSIGSLNELRDLQLSSNSFSGTIPLEFGNLVNLKKLYLEDIGRCSVENITWLSRLSHLEVLRMNGISLAKADHWVNTILSLQNLTTLNLEGCDLSKVMHPLSSSVNFSSFSSSSNIVRLYLSNNNLNSSMYPWLYPLTSNKLDTLDLSGNKLDEIPKYLGNLCGLAYLFFNNNYAPVIFSDFLKTLSAGCTSHTLYSLDASSSQFTGSISDDIQHFSSLETLYLYHNLLNGNVSEKMWELPMLGRVNISSNNISGKAPDLFTSFNGSSAALDLSSNNFFGPITNVSSALDQLNLSKNKFYGGISFLCRIVDGSLTYLDLSHNSFSGQIPDCLWNLKELTVLNLAHNNLSGRLPASVEYLIQLEVLYLYDNNFSGELPLSLRNCSMLTFLDLGANRFSGNVPVWIGENLSKLYVLNLGTNNFFGPIPLQVCQLVNLQILDLSVNNLNGTIPSCVNNLTSMVHKRLFANKVREHYLFDKGVLLGHWHYADHLMIKWQGIIREFSNNIGLLRSIDLSSNNLTGEIPNELIDLHGLLALNLSKNALLGEIPHKIGQMKEIQILDLSGNNLSGMLPSTMSQLHFLNYLDVSYNNLTGRIPSSTQLQSFEPSKYTVNAGLCGPPLLTKSCPGDEELHVPSSVGDEGNIDELERWFYIGGAIGFAIGFWIVCSVLLVNRRGRHTFFHFLDTLEDWVYVKVMVFKAKYQRSTHE